MGSEGRSARGAAGQRPRSSHLDQLLHFMVQQKASDLHLKPMRPPLLRINGRLLPIKTEPLQPDMLRAMLDSILNERQRATLDETLAVDLGYSVDGLSRFRASIFTQRGTLGAVFRSVPFDFRSLDEWGLPDVLREFAALPQGLVLITGPTGSGKSSTLAAMMRLIAQTRYVHIVTVEDPIEFLLSDDKASITQREVGMDTPAFSTALRNSLRQDPDVIMVGEMRDADTMATVLTAAETGHLVFSTLHTNSATQTIDRIIDTFPEGNHHQLRQQLSTVLQAVVSMRLVERKGGKGRIAAVEILRQTPQVSKLILEGSLQALNEEIEASVSYHKMQSMNQSLAALVLHGVLEHKTALSVSSNPGDLDLMLRKFLFSASAGQSEDNMADSLSDFSKIQELTEIKRLYEEVQERHSVELNTKDDEIRRLRDQLNEAMDQGPTMESAGAEDLQRLREENDRLNKQVQLVRQEYAAKVERLNSRIKELSGSSTQTTGPATQEGGRGGFFRR